MAQSLSDTMFSHGGGEGDGGGDDGEGGGGEGGGKAGGGGKGGGGEGDSGMHALQNAAHPVALPALQKSMPIAADTWRSFSQLSSASRHGGGGEGGDGSCGGSCGGDGGKHIIAR